VHTVAVPGPILDGRVAWIIYQVTRGGELDVFGVVPAKLRAQLSSDGTLCGGGGDNARAVRGKFAAPDRGMGEVVSVAAHDGERTVTASDMSHGKEDHEYGPSRVMGMDMVRHLR
jgi:hypothetical protein